MEISAEKVMRTLSLAGGRHKTQLRNEHLQTGGNF